jgi:hypothetical protein
MGLDTVGEIPSRQRYQLLTNYWLHGIKEDANAAIIYGSSP